MGNCSSSPSEATKTVEAMEDVSVKKKTLDSAATFTPALPHSPDETVVSVPAATLASETPDAAVQAVMPTEALASEDSGSGPESDPHGIVDASAVADLRGFDAASAAAAYVKCMGKHMFGPADLSSDAALMSMASGQTIVSVSCECWWVFRLAAQGFTFMNSAHEFSRALQCLKYVSCIDFLVAQSAATMRRVHKELRELQHNLPCTPSSSILIRYDKARPQFMKVPINLTNCFINQISVSG